MASVRRDHVIHKVLQPFHRNLAFRKAIRGVSVSAGVGITRPARPDDPMGLVSTRGENAEIRGVGPDEVIYHAQG